MPPTLKELALRYLREKLESGDIKPGERLSELALSKEIGISRTPIREAINQLASEGFVDMAPREGAFVKQPSLREFKEFFEIREVLESHAAAKIAAASPSPAALAPLTALHNQIKALLDGALRDGRSTLSEAEIRKMFELDSAFHMTIIRMADNERLERLVRDSRVIGRLFDTFTPELTLEELKDACICHADILAALGVHDPKLSQERMSSHIRDSYELRLKKLIAHESVPAMGNVPPPLRRFMNESA